jgi:hypothetical protein
LIAAVCEVLANAGIPPPTGLSCTKLVFISSASYNGNLAGLTGANAQCNTLAANAKLSGTFMAWISTSEGSPSTTFAQSLLPYTLVNGTLIANNWTDLISGSIHNPINRNESGDEFGGAVWTQTNTNGTYLSNGNGCSGFTSTSGNGNLGIGVDTNGGWTNAGLTSPCSAANINLYCFQQ